VSRVLLKSRFVSQLQQGWQRFAPVAHSARLWVAAFVCFAATADCWANTLRCQTGEFAAGSRLLWV